MPILRFDRTASIEAHIVPLVSDRESAPLATAFMLVTYLVVEERTFLLSSEMWGKNGWAMNCADTEHVGMPIKDKETHLSHITKYESSHYLLRTIDNIQYGTEKTVSNILNSFKKSCNFAQITNKNSSPRAAIYEHVHNAFTYMSVVNEKDWQRSYLKKLVQAYREANEYIYASLAAPKRAPKSTNHESFGAW